jgi:hypothetical protein
MSRSQRAEQEFYEELNVRLKSQPDEWQRIPADQKEFLVPPDDFQYYVAIRQDDGPQFYPEVDATGLPIVFFLGIRLKPLDR